MPHSGRIRAPGETKAIRSHKSSGAGCLIPFGLVFGGIGLFVTIMLARDFAEDTKTRGWTEVPAELIRSEILVDKAKAEAPFLLEVEYRYYFGGQTRVSTRFARKEKWSDDYEELALKRAEFLGGDGSATCFVNPDDPTEAIMERESLWAGLLVLFPLLFVLIGGGIVWAGVASLRKKRKQASPVATPLSSTPKAKSRELGTLGAAIFFFVFFAIGLGILFPIGIIPYQRRQAAKDWIETPCEIIWSRVQSHEGDDSTTYSVDIFYTYAFAGAEHRSNRYSFVGGSSSGRSAKAAIVKRYPEGSRQVCYVDPDQPVRAVIDRSLRSIGFWFLIPTAFLLVGLIGGICTLSSAFVKARAKAAAASGLAATPSAPEAPSADSSLRLNPAKSRLTAFLGIGIFALFWNGIVSILIFSGELKPSGGFFGILPILFMIPFVLVGLGLIVAVFYIGLGLLNPKLELVLTPGQPHLGDKAHLSWRLKGSPSRLRSLKIVLVGNESATYQRGTTTHTDREPFYAQVLAEETSALAFYQGEVVFPIPHDLMYSFRSGSNRIEWEIRVIGDIKPGPDIADTSMIEILPAANA